MIVELSLFILWACSILYAAQFGDAMIPLLVLLVVMTAWYMENITETWK